MLRVCDQIGLIYAGSGKELADVVEKINFTPARSRTNVGKLRSLVDGVSQFLDILGMAADQLTTAP